MEPNSTQEPSITTYKSEKGGAFEDRRVPGQDGLERRFCKKIHSDGREEEIINLVYLSPDKSRRFQETYLSIPIQNRMNMQKMQGFFNMALRETYDSPRGDLLYLVLEDERLTLKKCNSSIESRDPAFPGPLVREEPETETKKVSPIIEGP